MYICVREAGCVGHIWWVGGFVRGGEKGIVVGGDKCANGIWWLTRSIVA